jgi:succinate dehydrogenase/fumarate reductase-like Fe-S protein
MGDGPTGKDRRRFNSAKASSLRQCQSCCSVCLCCLTSFVPKAWNPNLVDPHLELRAVYWIRVSFDHSQREFRGHQEEERRKVPVYNAHLNGAVVAFHAHSSKDNHHLIMNCALCRKYL